MENRAHHTLGGAASIVGSNLALKDSQGLIPAGPLLSRCDCQSLKEGGKGANVTGGVAV